MSSQRLSVTVDLTPEQVDVIAARVAELLAEREAVPAPPSPWMTAREAAELLRCMPQRVHELVSRGELSRFKEGGRLLLARTEVENLVRLQRVRSCSPPCSPLARK